MLHNIQVRGIILNCNFYHIYGILRLLQENETTWLEFIYFESACVSLFVIHESSIKSNIYVK